MNDVPAKLMSCIIKLNPYCFLVAGSFSNDDGDGDGNEDVKKAIGLLRKTTTSRFFVHFFTVLARLRRGNA